MTREEAIQKAVEYAHIQNMDFEDIADARYFDLQHLDNMAKECPPDLVDTYRSVRANFQDHWIVTLAQKEEPGCHALPSTSIILVYNDREVSVFESL